MDIDEFLSHDEMDELRDEVTNVHSDFSCLETVENKDDAITNLEAIASRGRAIVKLANRLQKRAAKVRPKPEKG